MLFSSSSRLVLLAAAAFSVGCSKVQEQASTQSANWLKDGMIAISRPVPGISSAPSHMLGFMPLPPVAHSGAWLSIDTAKRVLRVMEGDKEISVSSGEGFENLKPGTYHVLHKQRNALWYAPDSYFSSRSLPLPAQGDRSRFRRGALGEFVLYVDKETPIHSGPVWSAEVGGVRLGSADLSRMYYSLDVGAPIEVR